MTDPSIGDVTSELHGYVAPGFEAAGESFDVVAYELNEALDEPSSLTLTIVRYGSVGEQPDPANLLDQPAVFTLRRTTDNAMRTFAGQVVRATRLPDEDDVDTVELVVVPSLWRLGKRTDCRVFQEQTTQAIVAAVLTGAGIPADRQSWKLIGEPHSRIYCVQYRESDLAFVQRLLAEDGIYFAVHTVDGADHVFLSDDPSGLGDVDGETSLPFQEETSFFATRDAVTRVHYLRKVASDKVHLRDYSAAKPKLNLWADAEGSDPGAHALEVYEHPGRFEEPAPGKARAKILTEAHQARRVVVGGETGSLGLAPGRTMTIEDHPFEPCNGRLLLLSVKIAGRTRAAGQAAGGNHFSCSFTGVPTANGAYRPPPIEAARSLPGVALAFTTGASGSEIHVNEQGDVKVQYPWDRLGKHDDKSSRWIRTSQVPLGGSMLLPRVGWEVTVAHHEGDVDRPYVMGRLYNGEKPPPYALPQNKGKSTIKTDTTPGGGSANSLEMSDNKGDEAMSFGGSHDMAVDVGNNATSTVSGSLTKTVGANQTINVSDSVKASIGADQVIAIGGNQHVTSQTYMNTQTDGAFTLDIGGKRGLMVGGDHKRKVDGDSSVTVNGPHFELTVGDVTDETLANYAHDVGAALVEITAADRVMTVGTTISESTGGLKLIATADARTVSITGSFSQNVGGALIYSVKGDKTDEAGGTYLELAAGAQFVKADTIVFEAQNMLSLVMGASVVTMMPGIVMIAGVSVKLDGPVNGELLVLNN
jgi:type VI secretion system secreted protein VgrG